MQYVGRAIGSVSKTWNSINPATLTGAIDVIVIEQDNGDLACSPFHVRFGKFALLQPSQKKVDFSVNGKKVDFAMKLGDGGEAFFVFETDNDVPSDLLTSPVLSPSTSAVSSPASVNSSPANLQEPEYLDLSGGSRTPNATVPHLMSDTQSDSNIPRSHIDFKEPTMARPIAFPLLQKADTTPVTMSNTPDSLLSTSPASDSGAPLRSTSADRQRPRASSYDNWPSIELSRALLNGVKSDDLESTSAVNLSNGSTPPLRPRSPPLSRDQAIQRAKELSRKLSVSRIPTTVTDSGDLVLDMRGYKAGEEETARAEAMARKILSEELAINTEIASLIAPDEHGNLWIYASEEARNKAVQRPGSMEFDYEPDESVNVSPKLPASQLSTPPSTPPPQTEMDDSKEQRNYVKTLRLTSDQLKSLNLVPGMNPVSFNVNGGRAVCTARMFYWRYDLPIVISDIDGTITKSDALGHVLTMLGRDWTHAGVAKLFTDIANNGYNLMYLTSRSVGQADSTRHYLRGIEQGIYKLPDGPVILSPDRTIAALRREVIYRKPEVFKMACLRDIQSLFGLREGTPFYAGFGNRITDALSYRSVGVPSSRIFTINSNADVHMELLELAGYKSSYVHMTDLVDHFFPPVSAQVGDERFTDVNFWRDPVPEIADSDEEGDSSTVRSNGFASAGGPSRASLDEEEEEDYDDDDEDDNDNDEDEDEEEDEVELDGVSGQDGEVGYTDEDDDIGKDIKRRL
ncbi:Lipin/Ned1/Smp2-domain-containing protein [Lipomyces tetrasporus]|uniref:Lipin/Ned1/Smp2-domain-containing protein n=1 Tax=Lipomyces tetrasporus TaxID=54092 RepID=A0AAD7VNW5_9ASCO|nr:Lipin/Ned1/Smp2-domain-containing protein [Lipomyces tetrasporus]KAJ8096922.1 Lipin/Ned1/Smp2-domain-containing protein [Lipomyces tetrasporus]